MQKQFRISALTLGVLAAFGAAPAFASWTQNPIDNINLNANNDSLATEGVYITSNGSPADGSTAGSAANITVTSASGANGQVNIHANGSTNINTNAGDGGTTIGSGNWTAGAGQTLTQDGSTFTVVDGANAGLGYNNLAGVINYTRSLSTGVETSATDGTHTATLNVSSNGTTAMQSSGSTSINTGSLTGNVSIGSGAATSQTIALNSGTNGGSLALNNNVNSSTYINAGSSNATVYVGNANNSTYLNSAVNMIGGTPYVGATTANYIGYTGASAAANSFNFIGTGINTSYTGIGNTNVNTQVVSNAGNAMSGLANNMAVTTVTDVARGTTAGMSVVNNGTLAANGGFVVDGNGKISAGTAVGTTASFGVQNPGGYYHGIVVQERQTTITGGTASSAMMLNDNGATFSNSVNGAPIQVHGVADGTSDFDAVNWRQLRAAYRGVAGVAAMNGIAGLDTSKQFALGVGVGGFKGNNALAIAGQARFMPNGVLRGNVAIASGANVVSVGANWSW